MTQGAPEAGREVGLMYSFSSQSDDGFSPLVTTDAGRDLTGLENTKHRESQVFISVVSKLDSPIFKYLRVQKHTAELCTLQPGSKRR